jgi:hypothetical protein
MKHAAILGATWLAVCNPARAADPTTSTPPASPVATVIGHVAANSVVEIELDEPLSSAVNYKGNTFAIRLAEPIVAAEGVLVPAGTPGVGEVISAGTAGMAGQAGKLVLAVRYIEFKGQRIPLHGLGLSRNGDDKSELRNDLMLAGAVSAGIGIIGAGLSGEDAVIQKGVQAEARLVSDLSLPVLAPPGAVAPSPPRPHPAKLVDGISPPPGGKGQVVFFRPPRRLSSRFTLMEGSTPLADLASETFFVLPVEPGLHTFQAQPAANSDSLTLEVNAGETYYVQEATIGGAFVTVPVLYLRDQMAFASQPYLKLAQVSTR